LLRLLGERGTASLSWIAAESGIEYNRLQLAANGLARDGILTLAEDIASFTE